MFTSLILASLFFLSTVLQSSLIHSWPPAWNFFPLHLIIGLIIMHRHNISTGALWFLLTIIPALWGFHPGSAWSYLAVALVSFLLISRLFTNRSVYALLGLGITISALYLAMNLALGEINFDVSQIIIFEIETIFGLYIGNLLASYSQRLAARWIYVRGL